MEWLICFGIGTLSGLISGLLGSGGGWIIIPGLTLGLPYAGVAGPEVIKVAIATNHTIGVFVSLRAVGAFSGKGGVDWNMGFRMIPGLVLGVVGGALLAAHVNVRYVTVLFVLGALYIAYRMAKPEPPVANCAPPPSVANLSAKGLTIGGIIGAVGGGGLTVPLFVRYMPIQKAIGTSAMVTIPTALAAVSSYAIAKQPLECQGACIGFIHLPAVCATGVAAVLSTPVGSALAHRLPVQVLKRIFAAALVFVAVNMARKVAPTYQEATSVIRTAFQTIAVGSKICRERRTTPLVIRTSFSNTPSTRIARQSG